MARQGRSRRPFFPRSRRDARSAQNKVSHTAHHRRLRVEPLEDRRMLAVFTVDNLDDAGVGSLRQAIDDANANLGADTVEFQAGLAGTIALSTGEMTITDELTIDGPGAEDLTVDAQQNSRIFRITPASGPVTLEGLHLTGGAATGNGGAILSETLGLLSIESSVISDSSAVAADFREGGGGIFAAGDVAITGSTISGNSVTSGSSGAGGGIRADGDVTVTDSTISGNSIAANKTGYSGGIFSHYGDVTITGSTISGNSASGDFARGAGIFAFLADVTITGSTISGNSAEADTFGVGGGIQSAGDVTVTGSTISDNSVTGGVLAVGGGIRASGDVTITRSTIAGNTVTGDGTIGASGRGGAILSSGDVTVTDSTISDNSVTSESLSEGGGIYARGDATIMGSTISGNSTMGGRFSWGGGMKALGTVTVTLSTISGNSAVSESIAEGGGIRVDGDLTITSSTISGNTATGATAVGGGIWNRDDLITIENSIIAGNHADFTAPDLRPGTGPLTIRYSLIGDNSGTGLAPAPVGMPDANGNLIGTAANPIDPMLGPLQDNGGPTFTHALMPGSPAINAGDPAFAPPPDFDQRGDPFARVSDGRIDMGAFERQPVTLDERIEHLLDTGVLNRGQANSLLVKLNSAGNERAQLNRLWAFINEVNAMVRAGILSAAEGQKLIDGAESLRMSLSIDAVLPLLVGRG